MRRLLITLFPTTAFYRVNMEVAMTFLDHNQGNVTYLKMPSVDAPWCCRTDSARVGKIQGNLSEGNRSACASIISSRVAPNMDGWNTEDCKQEMAIRPNKLKLLDHESFDFRLIVTWCNSTLRKYIWVHLAVIIACATQNMLLIQPKRKCSYICDVTITTCTLEVCSIFAPR